MKQPKTPKAGKPAAAVDPARYRLRLYVSGATSRSTHAIANIRAIGERLMSGHYDLEVIDVYQQSELLREEQIVVLPTLIKSLPLPLRRMVGDLSDKNRVLLCLGLEPEAEPEPEPEPGDA
jgi:circadian clock protein KaiB